MAVAVQSVSSNGTGATSLVITKPSGLAVGDLMIATVGYGTSGAGAQTISPPSGSWAAVVEPEADDGGANTRTKLSIFKKIADSADVAASNFTFTCSLAIRGGIYRIDGHSPSTPVETFNSFGVINDATPVTGAATVTPTRANSLLIFSVNTFGSTDNSSYSVATSNPSWTEDYELSGLSSAHATRTETTATGDATFAHNGTASTDSCVAIIVINPTIDVTVSPSTVTGISTVNTPAISGGAAVSPSTVTGSSTVNTPSHMEQADWSNPSKHTSIWTNPNKS